MIFVPVRPLLLLSDPYPILQVKPFPLLFSDNCLRFITKSLSLHVCFDSGTTFILLRDFPSYSSYNLSTEAVLLFNIPTAYLIIPSITTCLLL